MVYPYMTLADGTEIVHTQVFEEDGVKKVEVHFERPAKDGFDTARCQFDQFMRSNAHLFYKYGANGGVQIA